MPMSAPNPAWVSDEELAQTQLAGYAAKQLSGLEVDRARGGSIVAIGVAIDLGDLIARTCSCCSVGPKRSYARCATPC